MTKGKKPRKKEAGAKNASYGGWEVWTPLSLPLIKGKPLKKFMFEDHDVQPFRRQSQLLQ